MLNSHTSVSGYPCSSPNVVFPQRGSKSGSNLKRDGALLLVREVAHAVVPRLVLDGIG